MWIEVRLKVVRRALLQVHECIRSPRDHQALLGVLIDGEGVVVTDVRVLTAKAERVTAVDVGHHRTQLDIVLRTAGRQAVTCVAFAVAREHQGIASHARRRTGVDEQRGPGRIRTQRLVVVHPQQANLKLGGKPRRKCVSDAKLRVLREKSLSSAETLVGTDVARTHWRSQVVTNVLAIHLRLVAQVEVHTVQRVVRVLRNAATRIARYRYVHLLQHRESIVEDGWVGSLQSSTIGSKCRCHATIRRRSTKLAEGQYLARRRPAHRSERLEEGLSIGV